jgi:spore coat polysaccharide biosynthesis protein SpsF
MPKTIIVIQARTGSGRLPGKVLFDLEGKTILERVIERCQAADVGEVVVATTTALGDLSILKICSKIGVPCFCGSENDVLDRFVKCAARYNADHIVRITADCSMIDPIIIRATVDYYHNHENFPVDYCASRMIPTAYPDGMDVEIFNFHVLRSAARNAKSQYDREHVTTWIKRNEKTIRVNLPSDRNFGEEIRLSIDTRKDYEYAKEIYRFLYPKNNLFGLEEIFYNFIDWKTRISSIITKEGQDATL